MLGKFKVANGSGSGVEPCHGCVAIHYAYKNISDEMQRLREAGWPGEPPAILHKNLNLIAQLEDEHHQVASHSPEVKAKTQEVLDNPGTFYYNLGIEE